MQIRVPYIFAVFRARREAAGMVRLTDSKNWVFFRLDFNFLGALIDQLRFVSRIIINHPGIRNGPIESHKIIPTSLESPNDGRFRNAVPALLDSAFNPAQRYLR